MLELLSVLLRTIDRKEWLLQYWNVLQVATTINYCRVQSSYRSFFFFFYYYYYY